MLWKAVLFVGLSTLFHILATVANRWLPRAKPVDISDWPPEMIAAVANRAERFGNLIALAVMFTALPLWIVGGYWLDSKLWPTLEPGEFLVVPNQATRAFRAIVGTTLLMALGALIAVRVWSSWRFDLFSAAHSRQFGSRGQALFYWAFIWVLPFCIEYELHALGCSARIRGDAVYIRDSLLWPVQRHAYHDLVRIELAKTYRRPPQIHDGPECRLTFRNGHTFTDYNCWLPWDDLGTESDWPTVATFVSRQSGIPVQVMQKIN